MRRVLLLVALLVLAGCQDPASSFTDWHQELGYLRRQTVVTRTQYKRLMELEDRIELEIEVEGFRRRQEYEKTLKKALLKARQDVAVAKALHKSCTGNRIKIMIEKMIEKRQKAYPRYGVD